MSTRLSDETLENAGKLLLRVTIAGLMLFHGIHKLFYGIGGVRNLLAEHGLPQALAAGVVIGEVVAPVLVLLGWLSRPAALVFAFNMVVAIGIGHHKDVLRLGSNGQSAIELQLLYLLGALAIALLGPGRYALGRKGTWLE